MIYCDTSILVSSLTKETGTKAAQTWLRRNVGAELCISGWVETEFSSAVAMKLRAGVIDAPERAQILVRWHSLIAQSLTVIPISEAAFALAARFIDRSDVDLRAGDALHVALASMGGHSLATLDKAMAKAALAVGETPEPI